MRQLLSDVVQYSDGGAQTIEKNQTQSDRGDSISSGGAGGTPEDGQSQYNPVTGSFSLKPRKADTIHI